MTRGDETTNNTGTQQAMYTSKLTVYADVIMLKSCSWEAQIRKRASDTFTDLVTDWCKTATMALEATEKQKRKRLGLTTSEMEDLIIAKKATTEESSSSSSSSDAINEANSSINATTSSSNVNDGSELIARHRRNFQELDNLIAKGDLEYCSIEVMHSSKAGKHSAYARVLESDGIAGSLSKSSTEETETTEYSTEESRVFDVIVPPPAAVTVKRKSRNFLRLLSSRKGKIG